MLTDYLHSSDPGLGISQRVAIASFFLLFPGFLFYHQFVAMGLIPPFAAGLFGYVALGTLLALLALLPWNPDRLKKTLGNRYVVWALVFLVYASVWTLAHYLLLSGDYITKASRQSAETVILWSSLFLVGLILPLAASTLRWSFFISFCAILGTLLYFYLSTGDTMYNAHRLYGNTTEVSTYQGFARSVLITLLLLLSVFSSLRARAFFILGGVFVLYLLISRSDFYGFIAAAVVLCIVAGPGRPGYFLLLALLLLEVFMLARPDISPRLGAFTEALAPKEAVEAPAAEASAADSPGPVTRRLAPESSAAAEGADPAPTPDQAAEPPRLSRQFEVFDFTKSTSWAGRLALQRTALEQIAERPLLGRFGGHVLTEDTGPYARGHTGRYAHNALSAWVTYGLAGFILYVSLTLAGFLVAARQVLLKRQDTPLWTFAFTLNFVCLLLIIVSKPVYWPLPALGWGVLAQALLNPTGARS